MYRNRTLVTARYAKRKVRSRVPGLLPKLGYLVMSLNLRCFNSRCQQRRWPAAVGRSPFWEARHQSVVSGCIGTLVWGIHRKVFVPRAVLAKTFSMT